jgi:hypothetical protein
LLLFDELHAKGVAMPIEAMQITIARFIDATFP